MGKNTCTSCGGSGVVKKNIQQETPDTKKPKVKLNETRFSNKPKDYKFKSNAQRKSPPKEKN